MQAIGIKNLKKEYSSGLMAVNNVCLNIRKGDFFALLGPNGAGKSSIISIMASLNYQSSGYIKIFNLCIKKYNNLIKNYINIVPQEINFNQFETPLEIIVHQAGYYGIKRNKALVRAEILLKYLGLWNKRNLSSRFLSGGMKRRLMLSRSLINQPKILLLDEPTTGIDLELRYFTWNFLKKINNIGTTIILTTHYLEEAEKLCKGIGIISKGKIIASTTIKKLKYKINIKTFIFKSSNKLPKNMFCENYNIIKINSFKFELKVKKQQSLNIFLKYLEKNKINIIDIYSKNNSLESFFFNICNE